MDQVTVPRATVQQVLDSCTDAVAGWQSLAPLAVRAAAVESLEALRAALQQCKPLPPPEAQTEAERVAYCAGWWAAMAAKAKQRMQQDVPETDCGNIEWADIPKEFNEWWDADRLTQTNPFREESPAYWAWEGWQARTALEQPQPEPFGYFRAEPFGWTDCAETDEGAKALYEKPPTRWTPATSPPDTERTVLVWVKGEWFSAWHYARDGQWMDVCVGATIENVTYWMEPTPPTTTTPPQEPQP